MTKRGKKKAVSKPLLEQHAGSKEAARHHRQRRKRRPASEAVDDIEEQLRRQRLKQKEPTAAVDSKPSPPSQLGGFEYDPEKKAYYPKGSRKRVLGCDPLSRNEEAFPSARDRYCYLELATREVQKVSAPFYSHLSSLCGSPQYRSRLVSRWRGRSLVDSMILSPASIDRDGVLVTLAGPVAERWDERSFGQDCCFRKHDRATWLRTFDLLPTGPSSSPRLLAITMEGLWWEQQRDEGLVWNRITVPYVVATVRVMRWHDAHVAFYAHTHEGGAHVGSFRYEGSEPSHHEEWLHFPCFINDMASNSHNASICFAAELNNRGCIYKMDDVKRWQQVVLGFPRSIPLCVVKDKANPQQFFFGHRNGQVTQYDDRNVATCWSSKAPRTLDCTLSIEPLNNMEHGFLTRGSSGNSRLYDRRMMSPGRTSVVYEFQLPEDTNALRSGQCNGIAVDPSDTVLLSPFVDADHWPQLGVWSLSSGEYLGSRSLATGSRPGSRHTTVEMKNDVTPAWVYGSVDDEHPGRLRPGAFGLWYMLSAGPAESGMYGVGRGNIHHVSFEGRLDQHSYA